MDDFDDIISELVGHGSGEGESTKPSHGERIQIMLTDIKLLDTEVGHALNVSAKSIGDSGLAYMDTYGSEGPTVLLGMWDTWQFIHFYAKQMENSPTEELRRSLYKLLGVNEDQVTEISGSGGGGKDSGACRHIDDQLMRLTALIISCARPYYKLLDSAGIDDEDMKEVLGE